MHMLEITAIIRNGCYYVTGLTSPSAFNDESTWVKTALLVCGQHVTM